MFANSKKVTTFAPAIEREILDKKDGPFVYRLGRKIFILERGVRLSYGLRTKGPEEGREKGRRETGIEKCTAEHAPYG